MTTATGAATERLTRVTNAQAPATTASGSTTSASSATAPAQPAPTTTTTQRQARTPTRGATGAPPATRTATAAPPAAKTTTAAPPVSRTATTTSPRTELPAGVATPLERTLPTSPRPASQPSVPKAHRARPHIPAAGSSKRARIGTSAGRHSTDSAQSPWNRPTVTVGSGVRPAFGHHVAPAEPQPNPVGSPMPLPAASSTGGSAGGLGGLFFFGLAALLAAAGLVRPRVFRMLRRTVDTAGPQPFLCLLERPG